MIPATDPNIFRILVATDNHLGYAEQDPEKGSLTAMWSFLSCSDYYNSFKKNYYIVYFFHIYVQSCH